MFSFLKGRSALRGSQSEGGGQKKRQGHSEDSEGLQGERSCGWKRIILEVERKTIRLWLQRNGGREAGWHQALGTMEPLTERTQGQQQLPGGGADLRMVPFQGRLTSYAGSLLSLPPVAGACVTGDQGKVTSPLNSPIHKSLHFETHGCSF